MERRFFSCMDKIGINNYLTIIPLEDSLQAKLSDNDCEYCLDGSGLWKTLPAGEFTETVNAGHTLSFRANLTPKTDIGIGTIYVTKYFNLKGNCMSLLYGDNAEGYQTLPAYAFKSLFASNDNLFNANELQLPVKDVAAYAYKEMFKDCTSLVCSPTLPATSVGYGSYEAMFSGCRSLMAAPDLPAMFLGAYCYASMFRGCMSLTVASKLPATTLTDACYRELFYDCISLMEAPELPATTLSGSCYFSMFYGCKSLSTAPELPATTAGDSCYRMMFRGCTSLKTVPTTLPATILADNCYREMFHGCKSLVTAPELPATVLVTNCYWDMFNGCSNLNYIKMLATDISASNCLSWWSSGVASAGTFVKASGVEMPVGTSGIPSGWTVVEE